MKKRMIFVAAALLISCAVSEPPVETGLTPRQIEEEMLTAFQAALFEGNAKETRKSGLAYLEEFPGGEAAGEVRLGVGPADIELGFLTEAKNVLLPLVRDDSDDQYKGKAYLFLAEVDRAKGGFFDAAVALLKAMTFELDQVSYEKARKDLSDIVDLLPADQLERIRTEYPVYSGTDIVLEGCLSYALAASDTSYIREIRRHQANIDSLTARPEPAISRKIITADSRKEQAVDAAGVKIGLLCPLSGRFAPLGEAFLQGASLALREAQRRGLRGLEIVAGDTRSNALEARSITERLIAEEKVSAIVGGVLSSTTIAAAQVAEYNGVVLYSPVATEAGIEDIGEYIFQAPTDTEAELIALARVVCAEMGLRRIAFMSAEGPDSRRSEALFRAEVEREGGMIVIGEYYEQGSTDFQANISNIRKADPEALLIASDTEDLVLILPQLSFQEFGVQLLGTSRWNSRNLLRMSGRDMEGAVFPGTVDSSGKEERYLAASAYVGDGDAEPNRFSVGGYSGMSSILDVMMRSRESGSGLKEEMVRSLENRRHRYVEMVTAAGIPFITVKDERFVPMMNLRISP